MKRIHGLTELVFDMIDQTTSLVERTHSAVTDRSVGYLSPVEPVASVASEIAGAQQAIAAGVYQTIRAVNGGVRMAVSGAVGQATELAQNVPVAIEHDGAQQALWGADQLQALANGFYGDYFSRKDNTLAIPMHLRLAGRQVPVTAEALADAYPEATGKVCVFVHGLACTEWVWAIGSSEFYGDAALDFGRRLQDDCGYTPIYIRYNSGRTIADNSRELASLLSAVCEAYPVDVEQIVVVGHSMGGLVARGAAHDANIGKEPWVQKLRHVFCIGSPHFGSPLEQSVHWLAGVLSKIPTAATEVISEILETRSDGIKDLREGYTAAATGDDDEIPVVDGVGYYSLGATITRDADHPLGQILGDWLVRVPSATGQSSTRHIPFEQTRVFGGLDHVTLANHPDVYAAIKGWVERI